VLAGLLATLPVKNISRRTLDLPQRTVEALRSHSKRQLEENAGPSTHYEDSGLIFATGKDIPLDAQNVVSRHFKPLPQRAGLPSIRWHDLRHTCTTPSFWGAVSTRNSYSIYWATPA
jgi:integrase